MRNDAWARDLLSLPSHHMRKRSRRKLFVLTEVEGSVQECKAERGRSLRAGRFSSLIHVRRLRFKGFRHDMGDCSIISLFSTTSNEVSSPLTWPNDSFLQHQCNNPQNFASIPASLKIDAIRHGAYRCRRHAWVHLLQIHHQQVFLLKPLGF